MRFIRRIPLSSRTTALVAPSVLCLALASLLLAFGADPRPSASASPAATPAPPKGALAAGYLTDRDVGAAPAGSPARAFLRWWQAVQYRDVRTGYAGLAAAVRARLPLRTFRRNLPFTASAFSGKPKVIGETGGGNAGTLRVMLTYYSGGAEVSAVPQSFAMVRDGRRWRLADTEYLDAQIRHSRQEAASKGDSGATSP